GADPRRDQGEMKRRSAGVDADGMADTKMIGHGRFEALDPWSEAERTGGEELPELRHCFGFDLSPLAGEIGERHKWGGHASCGSSRWRTSPITRAGTPATIA